jgi:hypothetical protein
MLANFRHTISSTSRRGFYDAEVTALLRSLFTACQSDLTPPPAPFTAAAEPTARKPSSSAYSTRSCPSSSDHKQRK